MIDNQESLDTALEICLKNLAEGHWTLEESLAHYPDRQGELEPLLRSANELRAARRLTAPLSFRVGAAARMTARLAKSSRKPVHPRPPALPVFPHRFFSFGAAFVVVLILAGASAGTISAAGGSLPGEPLYPVKLAVEQAERNFTPPDQMVGLYLQLAERRLQEAEKLAARGDGVGGGLQTALDGYDQVIADVTQSLTDGADGQALHAVENNLSAHQARLKKLRARVPEPARKGIDRAIEVSMHGQERAAEVSNGQVSTPTPLVNTPTVSAVEASATDQVTGTPTAVSTSEASEGQGGAPGSTPTFDSPGNGNGNGNANATGIANGNGNGNANGNNKDKDKDKDKDKKDKEK